MPELLYFRRGQGPEREFWVMWCPGCRLVLELADGRLAVEPSILVQGGPDDARCHSFLREGVWEFLSDSTHELAGQSVPMVPLPEYLQG